MQPKLALGAEAWLTGWCAEAAAGESPENRLAKFACKCGAWREPLRTGQGRVTLGVYREKRQEVETGWMEQEGCGGRLERPAGMNHTHGAVQIGHAGKGGRCHTNGHGASSPSSPGNPGSPFSPLKPRCPCSQNQPRGLFRSRLASSSDGVERRSYSTLAGMQDL